MTSKEQQDTDYDPLFSYNATRERYQGEQLSESHSIAIENLVRPPYLAAVRNGLLQDAAIFSTQPNTLQQLRSSAISRQFLWELHSGIMLRLLENITGLTNLLPDTHCHASALFTEKNANIAARMPDTAPPHHLHAGMVLAIALDTGNAVICTPESWKKTGTANPPLFLATYWQYLGATT